MRKIVLNILCLSAVALISLGSVRADAASLSGLLQEAGRLLAEGDVAEALEAYRNIQVDFPEAEEAQFGIGCAQYIQGVGQLGTGTAEASAVSFQAAEEVFSRLSIAQNRTIREHAAYNRANSVAQTAKMIPAEQQYKEAVGAFRGAVSAYEGVLRDYPEHQFAAQNLDHVRFLLKQLLQNPPESEEEENPEDQPPKQVSIFGEVGTDIEGAKAVKGSEDTTVELVQPTSKEAQQ